MPRTRSWNPLAFYPIQVTFFASLAYIALFTLLIWSFEIVPPAPSTATPVAGVNLTETWLDLSFISDGYHPIDSRRNGVVKAFLLDRVREVLGRNEVGFDVVNTVGKGAESLMKGKKEKEKDKAVSVFVDGVSNVTFVDDFRQQPWSCYGESENIIVYIRGSNDDDGKWWESDRPYNGPAGVLVNAHYDSVSSGFGATDDGVGVVTLLQLLSHFTTDGHQPERGLVLLFNNGEENALYGAHEFLRHPLSQFTHTFLNLEGAGAGGRATLFRSTDTQVTRFYAKSPRPYGTVVSGDGFKRRLIGSGTDYSVFVDNNGMRGLDVAFFTPRARYHTDQDDARNTNPDSVWHMLSTALATTRALTSYDGDEFEGSVGRTGKLDLSSGNDGVWFDIFGREFAVLRLNTLFALSVVLLVVGPVLLIILEVTLRKLDKWYPLAQKQYLNSADDDEAVHFSGVRGLFRWPIAVAVATAAVLALAFLLTKINPYIMYSSKYAVWAMMLSAWFSIAWFLLAGADRVRPTALQRMYSLIWLYAFSWALLVAVTVGADRFHIGGGYFIVIYNACVFVALLISYLELLALPTKTAYVERVVNAEEEVDGRSVRPASRRGRTSRDHDEDEATERTSLLRGGDRRSGTFSRRQESIAEEEPTADPHLHNAYGDEQAWSSSLPHWTWQLQFLLLAPINLILIGQVALLVTAALHQTHTDGGASVLPLYLMLSAFTLLLLLPLTPFLHRFKFQVPTFLFFVFVGCLVYALLAFPFSREARFKFTFVQRIDLDTGSNNITLGGLDEYIQDVIAELPSAIGQPVHCSTSPRSPDYQFCSWSGLEPNVVPDDYDSTTKKDKKDKKKSLGTKSWLQSNITSDSATNTALFTFRAQNAKACRLEFASPISAFHFPDAPYPAASDPRFPSVAEEGSWQIRLFSRTWDREWSVNVTFAPSQEEEVEVKGQEGRIMCLWSDANVAGAMPAFEEVLRFAPVWSAVTKASDGLVEGFRKFVV
ncbi:peptidase M28 [Neohortaea acidophila]|uniref:Peptide hydrolase n=1 Tax=Neohortaea acidophila TaxID=245834 RepID=A0A6A6Q2N6_9PEZI|nr:peptidase M28 [Neohortaea acidophila]KAF2486512.1 peptidase M28 [Neohortaea acidophila]